MSFSGSWTNSQLHAALILLTETYYKNDIDLALHFLRSLIEGKAWPMMVINSNRKYWMDDIDDKDLAEHLREEQSNTTREGLIRFLQSKPEGKILTQKLLENGYVKFGVKDYKEK